MQTGPHVQMSNFRTGQLSPLVYRQLEKSLSPIGPRPDKVSDFHSDTPITFLQDKIAGKSCNFKT